MAGVTVATIVRNEADRFLRRALECWTEVADTVVAVDNGSTDGTAELLAEFGAETHLLEVPMDGREWFARRFLWEMVTRDAEDGDWLLWLDADHCFAGDPTDFLRSTTRNRVLFPVFDMWTPTAYRSDAWWRVRPWWQGVRWGEWAHNVEWEWPERGWHSGHVPLNSHVFGTPANVPDHQGLLHYGYATDELRKRHAAAYEARKAVLTEPERFHASTITDARPRLVGLPFEPKWRLL